MKQQIVGNAVLPIKRWISRTFGLHK